MPNKDHLLLVRADLLRIPGTYGLELLNDFDLDADRCIYICRKALF